jgi:predicted nucleic acid-binding protein
VKAIVDASFAFVMLATPERAAPLFVDATDILAPDLIVAEMLNARWKILRSGAAAPSLDTVLGFFDRIRLVASIAYAADAARFAQLLDHPVYDCLYAVVAKREGARLITADRRFAAKLKAEAIDVVML